MSEEVIFRAIGGALKDEEFVFDEKGLCLVGRSGDCALLIPKEKDMRISRRHCLFILDPPKVRVRDLGSRNGTFVNGEQLPAGNLGEVPEQNTPQDLVLKHGDKLNIGETEFEVLIPSQEAAVTAPMPPPPGTKVIKLAKPSSTRTGTLIPKSAPIDTGFFISPGLAKGKPVNTGTAPLTEAFMKPKAVSPQNTQPEQAPAPSPPANQEASAAAQKPRKVLKGRIVKKTPAPPAGAQNRPPDAVQSAPTNNGARKEYNPELTEIMNVNELSDDIKLSEDYIKKQKSKKRVTKFKVKGPK